MQERLDAEFPTRSVEVVNTGVSGLRARQHLSTLRHIAAYAPDLDIFLMGINDWNRHIWDEFGDPESAPTRQHWLSFSESLVGIALRALQAAFTSPPEPVVTQLA